MQLTVLLAQHWSELEYIAVAGVLVSGLLLLLLGWSVRQLCKQGNVSKLKGLLGLGIGLGILSQCLPELEGALIMFLALLPSIVS